MSASKLRCFNKFAFACSRSLRENWLLLRNVGVVTNSKSPNEVDDPNEEKANPEKELAALMLMFISSSSSRNGTLSCVWPRPRPVTIGEDVIFGWNTGRRLISCSTTRGRMVAMNSGLGAFVWWASRSDSPRRESGRRVDEVRRLAVISIGVTSNRDWSSSMSWCRWEKREDRGKISQVKCTKIGQL